ncbi:hypothetical protein GA0111570_103334 [Raineyella antarctica]|uniref:Uncharacterized protein n=1 Tax=Raineyella antarctica TaxID=1577474 RepID=A0A1G6GJ13_9ACTN|nr:hypothetical protein [Raineyella antarctica]SDB81735.1 hypothetical protein GA0111570_103334 [Raineyella antarctica]
MKIGLALRELHRSETDLTHDLMQAGERHKADHEIFYVANDLAAWSRKHVVEIARIAGNYGEHLDPDVASELTLMEKIREKGGQMLGRDASAGLLLLRDLRHILMQATGVSADWEMIGQAAQGIRHQDLLAVTERCHPETLRQSRWANSMIKESSTQILIS